MTNGCPSIVDDIFGVGNTRLAAGPNMENCDLES
jgi:hypothetical protein